MSSITIWESVKTLVDSVDCNHHTLARGIHVVSSLPCHQLY